MSAAEPPGEKRYACSIIRCAAPSIIRCAPQDDHRDCAPQEDHRDFDLQRQTLGSHRIGKANPVQPQQAAPEISVRQKTVSASSFIPLSQCEKRNLPRRATSIFDDYFSLIKKEQADSSAVAMPLVAAWQCDHSSTSLVSEHEHDNF